jgi:hypothetical protein
MPNQLMPLTILFVTAFLIVAARRARVVLADRRERRAAAEAAEYARMTGWIKKLSTENVGPAVTRDEHGNLVFFKGLRRYASTGRRTRRGRRA